MPAPHLASVFDSGSWELDLARRELRTNGVAVPLGVRAFDIVEVLVQSAGELVTKDEIMRRVWSRAIVEESTLQVHISAIRKALGPDRGLLKTAFGRGYRLTGSWTVREESRPMAPVDTEPILPRPDLPSQPNLLATSSNLVGPIGTNVPVAASALIGRISSAQHLRDLLSAYRVVTLTGPGGIGKTVLALEVARNLFSTFQGDVLLVELGSLSDPDLVAAAVAGVLDLELGGGEISAEAVARAIGAKKLLLVLDNCEHVVDAAARLAHTIVRLCPRTTVLATSREILRIEGECVYRVPPLEVPPEHSDNPSDVLQHSAVALFMARTKELNVDFSTVEEENRSAIAAICRRLDGIPLAIEFAAACAAMFGVQQVARGLGDRFRLLTTGRRTALPRHRTLRAALDWSHELLTELERCLLRRLAVFQGGFTLEAATAVMSDTGDAATAVAERIASLVAKSLLAPDGTVPSGRWRLLETIRAYALEKLAASGEAEQAARRHAEFFRDFFAAPASNAQLKSGIGDITCCVREIDNVRVALDWAFSPLGDPVVGIVLTAAYAPVWMRLSLVVECRERTERALDSLNLQSIPDARLTMRLYIELAAAAVYSEEETRDILGKALELAEGLDDEVSQLRAIWAIWSDRNLHGDYQGAQLFAERFAMVARRVGDPADILVGDRLVGTTMHYKGNQAQARRYLERVLALYVAPIDHRHTIWFYHNQRALARLMLARVLCLQGFLDQARHDAQSSLEDAQATDNALSIRYVLGWAVFPIALMTKDFAAAERSLATFIDISATALPYWKIWGGSLQGTLLIKRGEFAAGSALLSAALDTSVRPGWRMRFPDFLGILAEGLAGLGRLTEAQVTIEEAIERSNRDGECWCLAELLRIKGELLLKEATAQLYSAAEDCFVGAIDLAREQGALFWELRAALSLTRLLRDQGRPAEGVALLQPVYDRFTEGFETADLKAAKALLDALE